MYYSQDKGYRIVDNDAKVLRVKVKMEQRNSVIQPVLRSPSSTHFRGICITITVQYWYSMLPNSLQFPDYLLNLLVFIEHFHHMTGFAEFIVVSLFVAHVIWLYGIQKLRVGKEDILWKKWKRRKIWVEQKTEDNERWKTNQVDEMCGSIHKY